MPHAEITSAGTDEMLDNGTQDQALNNEASNSIPAINEASHSLSAHWGTKCTLCNKKTQRHVSIDYNL